MVNQNSGRFSIMSPECGPISGTSNPRPRSARAGTRTKNMEPHSIPEQKEAATCRAENLRPVEKDGSKISSVCRSSTISPLLAAVNARTSSSSLVKPVTSSDPVLEKFSERAPWTVSADEIDWENSDFVGKGSISHVFKAEYRMKTVAVKVLRLDQSTRKDGQLPNYSLDLLDELNVVSGKLEHPNIVEFIGAGTAVIDGDTIPLILYEYVSGGSVEDLFEKNSTKLGKAWMPQRCVSLSWCYQMLKALVFLHENETPLAHRDVKLANLLVSPDLKTVKLADFSLAAPMQEISLTSKVPSVAGSMRYMAPEVTRKVPYALDKADVYSAAITCWCLLSGQRPYDGIQDPVSAMRFAQKGMRPPQAPAHGGAVTALLNSAWDARPHRRPTARVFAEKLGKLLEREQQGWSKRIVRTVTSSFARAKRALHREVQVR